MNDGTVPVHVIRHGSTQLNSQNGSGPDRIRGWKNVPLSPKGRLEAAGAAQKLKHSGIKVLVHSDLDRAHDTAKAISRTTGAKMISSPGLRPWNLGHFTGKESNAVQDELRPYVCEHPDRRVPHGESFNEFKRRVLAAVGQAINEAGGQKLGLVTHHRVERLLSAWQAAGEPADGSIKSDLMFQHGGPPASSKTMEIKAGNLPHDNSHAIARMPASAPSGNTSSRASVRE